MLKNIFKGIAIGFVSHLLLCPALSSYEQCANKLWFDAEALIWFIKDSPEPVPLITTGPVVPDGSPVLGLPGTSILIGGKDISTGTRPGLRLTAGYWFDNNRIFGASLSYLYIGNKTKTQSVSSDGLPGSVFLALPFFNVTTASESSTAIALPGSFAGTATLAIKNRMQGADLNGLAKVLRSNALSLHAIAGFRYWNFNEELAFDTNSPSVPPPPDVFLTQDHFDTQNNFYAGQVGAAFEYRCNRFSIQAQGKIALGAMCETVKIDGDLITNDFDGFGALQVFTSGYLGMTTNNGRRSKTRFAVLPEINLNLAYQLTENLSLRLGYTFLYVNNVVRPGKQIDRGINPTQAPAISGVPSVIPVGPLRPKPLFNESDLWAQGVNLGVELSF